MAGLSYKEYFHNLRQTTQQVMAPLITLSAKRLTMIKLMVKYIEAQPETLQQLEMLQMYNTFQKQDQELVDITRGRIDDETNRS